MKRVLAYLLAILILCVSIPAAVFAENLSADHQLTIQNLKDLNGGSVQIELKKGHITFAGQDVCDLAQKYGTPLYLMDEDKIRENCRTYKAAMDACFASARFAAEPV